MACANVLTRDAVSALLGQRRRDCSKLDNGRGLLLAGSSGFSGAAVMAAAAALRGGIGLLKVACPQEVAPAFFALPEAMVVGIENWQRLEQPKLDALLNGADCVAAGPGMGRTGVLQAVRQAVQSRLPCVLDADALNALAGSELSLHENIVLTPHVREMGRLCKKEPEEIAAQPEYYARKYAATWGCTVLLKGAHSTIAAADGRAAINTAGNSGLAKGGSGDVLTGIILALLGQGLKPFDAACAGAYLLGVSADEALGLLAERALLSRDVIGAISRTLERFA